MPWESSCWAITSLFSPNDHQRPKCKFTPWPDQHCNQYVHSTHSPKKSSVLKLCENLSKILSQQHGVSFTLELHKLKDSIDSLSLQFFFLRFIYPFTRQREPMHWFNHKMPAMVGAELKLGAGKSRAAFPNDCQERNCFSHHPCPSGSAWAQNWSPEPEKPRQPMWDAGISTTTRLNICSQCFSFSLLFYQRLSLCSILA